jgi:hypothetical protein
MTSQRLSFKLLAPPEPTQQTSCTPKSILQERIQTEPCEPKPTHNDMLPQHTPPTPRMTLFSVAHELTDALPQSEPTHSGLTQSSSL